MSFLIRHSDGRQYELDDYALFQADYEPSGFVIVAPQPRWGVVPKPPSTAVRDKVRAKAAETNGAAE